VYLLVSIYERNDFGGGQGNARASYYVTNVVPKPMIPLLGKSIMESIIEHLSDSGIDQIVIKTSHLAHVIQDYFGGGSRFGLFGTGAGRCSSVWNRVATPMGGYKLHCRLLGSVAQSCERWHSGI
jgi:hypothetical protein